MLCLLPILGTPSFFFQDKFPYEPPFVRVICPVLHAG